MADPQLQTMKEPEKRLQAIAQNLYSTCYERVTQGMLHKISTRPAFSQLATACSNPALGSWLALP